MRVRPRNTFGTAEVYCMPDVWGRIQRGKNLLKNRLRIRLRLNFESMTCLNYLFLDFFQYKKSQADSQADSQAVFQAGFFPSGSDPCACIGGTQLLSAVHMVQFGLLYWGILYKNRSSGNHILFKTFSENKFSRKTYFSISLKPPYRVV